MLVLHYENITNLEYFKRKSIAIVKVEVPMLFLTT